MRTILTLLLGAAALSPAAGTAHSADYHLAGSIAAPGDGGWDYARFDEEGRTLYVAHGDAVSTIDVVAGRAGRPLGPVAHAHAVVPMRGGVVAVTSGGDATVRLFDAGSGRQLASIPVGEDPDAAIVDPATGHLLTMNAKAGTISEIDVPGRRVVRTIAARPALEYAAIGRGRRLYVNDEDLGEIEVIDLATGALQPPIALPGCEAPSGLGYDAAHDRLIAACANGRAAVVDAGRRRLVQLVAIGSGPDAVIVDQRRGRAFIPCGRSARLAVLDIAGPGRVTKIADVPTEPGARTGALHAATGTVFLPTARLLPATDGRRPTPAAGSFHVLRIEQSATLGK